MASFRLLAATGFSVAPWSDPERAASGLDPGAPSRITTRFGAQPLRVRCTVGDTVRVQAIRWDATGVEPDSGLGGRLYVPTWVEVPNGALPTAQRPRFAFPYAGYSALIDFAPPVVGHYLLEVRRAREGSALLHFDAEAA